MAPRAVCGFTEPKDPGGCYPLSAFVALANRDCDVPEGVCFSTPIVPLDDHGHPSKDDLPSSFSCQHSTATATVPVMADEQLPPATQDYVAVPSDNALADIQKLVPAGGDASLNTVLLAAIGVAGGGAAWKFYNDYSKRKHEERMKKIEQSEDSHQKCSAERAALEAKISTLEARFAEAERRPLPGLPELPFDPDDFRQRLEKLEKPGKTAKKPRANGR